MKKFTKFFFITVFIIPLLSGCGIVYGVLLGVDTTPEWNLDKKITKQAKKYKIPAEYNLVMDTVSYYNGLTSIYRNLFKELEISETDSTNYFTFRKVVNDDTQPVHFRLFDNNGNEIFKIVNCYVDPPIPMNWNVEGCFDTFPPKIEIETLNTHNYDIEFLLSHSSLLNQSKITLNDLPQADYYGVVIWNEFFRRPSKKLIKTVRKKVETRDESLVMIYINNQNAYLWQIMDSETKEKVKSHYNAKKL